MSIQIENVLIIDTNKARVMRVRSAAKLEANFSSVNTVSTLEQAIERLEIVEYQLVFVAQDLPEGEICSFVEKARELHGGKIASYISISSGATEQHEFATQLLQGFDGILKEPFSIDSFQEILEISLKLLTERSEKLQKAIIELAIADASTFIDIAAGRIRMNAGKAASARSVGKLQSTLESCCRANADYYFEVLVDKFIELSNRKRGRSSYSGASKRLRKKLEESGS